MPEQLSNVTVGEVVAWIAGLSVLVGVLWKLWGAIRPIQTFLRDWSGKPARKDRAGNVIEGPEPGVLGKLDTMRSDMDRVLKQVENSHNTNFRDDLDVVRANIERVGDKLDEHIVISKHHDREQETTRKALDEHIESTQKWTGMLEDLHDRWSNKGPPPPDDQ